MREILTHGSVRGSNAHPRNTHPKAQKQKCGHRAKVESKDCGLVLYSTTDRQHIPLKRLLDSSFHQASKYLRVPGRVNFYKVRMCWMFHRNLLTGSCIGSCID